MKSIDEQIRKAQEEGKFDDLPGTGKPLQLDHNPHEDPGWRLAMHMLRANGFSLPWIEERKEIEAELQEARGALERAWRLQCSPEFSTAAELKRSEWRRSLDRFRRQIETINRRIFEYNLQTPSPRFQLSRVDAEREIQAVAEQSP